LKIFAKCNYFGVTVINKLIQKEIEKRLNSNPARYYSVQNILFSRLLSKNVTIRVYETKILHVILYGCKTYSLALKEDQKLYVFENRVLRRIFGLRRDEVTGG
jgi:hypothetical protein